MMKPKREFLKNPAALTLTLSKEAQESSTRKNSEYIKFIEKQKQIMKDKGISLTDRNLYIHMIRLLETHMITNPNLCIQDSEQNRAQSFKSFIDKVESGQRYILGDCQIYFQKIVYTILCDQNISDITKASELDGLLRDMRYCSEGLSQELAYRYVLLNTESLTDMLGSFAISTIAAKSAMQDWEVEHPKEDKYDSNEMDIHFKSGYACLLGELGVKIFPNVIMNTAYAKQYGFKHARAEKRLKENLDKFYKVDDFIDSVLSDIQSKLSTIKFKISPEKEKIQEAIKLLSFINIQEADLDHLYTSDLKIPFRELKHVMELVYGLHAANKSFIYVNEQPTVEETKKEPGQLYILKNNDGLVFYYQGQDKLQKNFAISKSDDKNSIYQQLIQSMDSDNFSDMFAYIFEKSETYNLNNNFLYYKIYKQMEKEKLLKSSKNGSTVSQFLGEKQKDYDSFTLNLNDGYSLIFYHSENKKFIFAEKDGNFCEISEAVDKCKDKINQFVDSHNAPPYNEFIYLINNPIIFSYYADHWITNENVKKIEQLINYLFEKDKTLLISMLTNDSIASRLLTIKEIKENIKDKIIKIIEKEDTSLIVKICDGEHSLSRKLELQEAAFNLFYKIDKKTNSQYKENIQQVFLKYIKDKKFFIEFLQWLATKNITDVDKWLNSNPEMLRIIVGSQNFKDYLLKNESTVSKKLIDSLQNTAEKLDIYIERLISDKEIFDDNLSSYYDYNSKIIHKLLEEGNIKITTWLANNPQNFNTFINDKQNTELLKKYFSLMIKKHPSNIYIFFKAYINKVNDNNESLYQFLLNNIGRLTFNELFDLKLENQTLNGKLNTHNYYIISQMLLVFADNNLDRPKLKKYLIEQPKLFTDWLDWELAKETPNPEALKHALKYLINTEFFQQYIISAKHRDKLHEIIFKHAQFSYEQDLKSYLIKLENLNKDSSEEDRKTSVKEISRYNKTILLKYYNDEFSNYTHSKYIALENFIELIEKGEFLSEDDKATLATEIIINQITTNKLKHYNQILVAILKNKYFHDIYIKKHHELLDSNKEYPLELFPNYNDLSYTKKSSREDANITKELSADKDFLKIFLKSLMKNIDEKTGDINGLTSDSYNSFINIFNSESIERLGEAVDELLKEHPENKEKYEKTLLKLTAYHVRKQYFYGNYDHRHVDNCLTVLLNKSNNGVLSQGEAAICNALIANRLIIKHPDSFDDNHLFLKNNHQILPYLITKSARDYTLKYILSLSKNYTNILLSLSGIQEFIKKDVDIINNELFIKLLNKLYPKVLIELLLPLNAKNNNYNKILISKILSKFSKKLVSIDTLFKDLPNDNMKIIKLILTNKTISDKRFLELCVWLNKKRESDQSFANDPELFDMINKRLEKVQKSEKYKSKSLLYLPSNLLRNRQETIKLIGNLAKSFIPIPTTSAPVVSKTENDDAKSQTIPIEPTTEQSTLFERLMDEAGSLAARIAAEDERAAEEIEKIANEQDDEARKARIAENAKARVDEQRKALRKYRDAAQSSPNSSTASSAAASLNTAATASSSTPANASPIAPSSTQATSNTSTNASRIAPSLTQASSTTAADASPIVPSSTPASSSNPHPTTFSQEAAKATHIATTGLSIAERMKAYEGNAALSKPTTPSSPASSKPTTASSPASAKPNAASSLAPAKQNATSSLAPAKPTAASPLSPAKPTTASSLAPLAPTKTTASSSPAPKSKANSNENSKINIPNAPDAPDAPKKPDSSPEKISGDSRVAALKARFER